MIVMCKGVDYMSGTDGGEPLGAEIVYVLMCMRVSGKKKASWWRM